MIRDQQKEGMPRSQIEQLQLERLQAMLNRLYSEVSYYRNLLDSADLLPSEFRSLDQLAAIPFTRKENAPGQLSLRLVRGAFAGDCEDSGLVGYDGPAGSNRIHP